MTKDRVVNSVNNEFANRCVDFFVRFDGRFGYKEFRRDPEDQGAWFIIAFDESRLFARYEDALESAKARVAWLSEAVERAAPFVP
jgi:hypothetical protein